MSTKFVSRSVLLNLVKLKQIKGLEKPVLRIFSRNIKITASFIDLAVEVHNGKKFVKFLVVPEMVGFRFGDFSFTKKMGIIIHKEKIKKK